MAVGTLVDSNVLLDVLTDDAVWGGWSASALGAAARSGPLVVNPLVFAEVSCAFASLEAVRDAVDESTFVRAALPYEAAFLAGRAFLAYRRRGGARRSPMPDFYVGAHAAVADLRLLTRDAARYRTCFPTVEVVSPPAPH